MSAIGQYLEEEGVATTLVSLVREHTEVMRPPRALWVPFALGRPFGAPHEPKLQADVLMAALALLEEPAGPILRDFATEIAYAPSADFEGASCPVNFSRPPTALQGTAALGQALREEIAQLRPWFDQIARSNERTTYGLSGLTPEQAGEFIVGRLSVAFSGDSDPEMVTRVKNACDDLRAFYEEAGAAQPGALSSAALERWYYLDTVAGKVLRALREICLSSDDPPVQHFGKLVLIPRAILHAGDSAAPSHG